MSGFNEGTYYLDLGTFAYEPVWRLQKKIVEAKIARLLPDILLVVEHPSVYTMGKSSDSGHLLVEEGLLKTKNIPVLRVERGGDITWHGPGQLVCYPIFSLNGQYADLHRFVRMLEECIILTLKKFGLNGRRKETLRGVWVEDQKIASIGLAVSGRTTYHGVALNVSPDMFFFDWIVPCGLSGVRMGSMSGLLGKEVSMSLVKETYSEVMAELFGLLLKPVTQREVCEVYGLSKGAAS